MMPETRCDPLTGDVVLLAAERWRRPNEYPAPPVRRAGDVSDCPFCPENDHLTPQPRADYPADGPWQVRVVPNKYPVVAGARSPTSPGRHEVLIESRRHVASWSDLTEEQQHLVWQASQHRLQVCRDQQLPYAQLFKNTGPSAGASIEHCHSQLIATADTPRRVLAELQGCDAWRQSAGSCFFCQLAAEPARRVAATPQLVAVCPYASRFPYEVWLLPRQHCPRFEEAGPQLLLELAQLSGRIVRALELALDRPAYNWLLHTTPFASRVSSYHWHLELFPRLARMAGYEMATGQYINVVPPEQAAQVLREAAASSAV